MGAPVLKPTKCSFSQCFTLCCGCWSTFINHSGKQSWTSGCVYDNTATKSWKENREKLNSIVKCRECNLCFWMISSLLKCLTSLYHSLSGLIIGLPVAQLNCSCGYLLIISSCVLLHYSPFSGIAFFLNWLSWCLYSAFILHYSTSLPRLQKFLCFKDKIERYQVELAVLSILEFCLWELGCDHFSF